MSGRSHDVWEVVRGALFLVAGCIALPAVLLAHVAAVLAG